MESTLINEANKLDLAENAWQVSRNDQATKNKLTMIVFSGDMDKVFAAFMIATGAAASGMEVCMFFTFWGIKAIQKPGQTTGHSLFGRMLGVMNRGGLDAIGPSRLNMGGMGRWMFKKMMKEKGASSLPELYDLAVELGIVMMPCITSQDVMEIDMADLQPNVTQPVGVATMLENATESKFTLFI
jgi:peroxiredoxin family protein